MELETLRARLTALDTEIIKLAAERQKIVSEIGQSKIRSGRGTRDYTREKVVIETARNHAEDFGLPPHVAEQVMGLLIRSSLARQEQEMVVAHGSGSGKRALIIGGLGKIGAWFNSFLTAQGFNVQLADSAGDDVRVIKDWKQLTLDHELIVVAAPLKISGEILLHLAEIKPEGVIFDVASLKSPVSQGLEALQKAGCKVTSVHPMFGPDTQLLSGKHVIFVDLGNAEANQFVKGLFQSTMAVQVDMSLHEHDRLIAYVLGLSHALNIIFFTALSASGEKAEALAKMSSTTFDAQLQVASRVADESPHLYFEIQTLNEYKDQAIGDLKSAVERFCGLVHAEDEAGFTELMKQGQQYLKSRADHLLPE